MCDTKKYSRMFQDIKQLQPEDTLQLVMEAESEEEQDFFEMVGNFLLQQKQKQVIERNLFWWRNIASADIAKKRIAYRVSKGRQGIPNADVERR